MTPGRTEHPIAPHPAAGMRTVEEWIPMPDGVRLAATLYMPEDAPPDRRFPPILEYLPYRKDDGLLERDHRLYGGIVPRGFVGARVDIRGTGRSEGRLPEGEYSEQEHRDALVVIDWLATRPWSSGRVGMWGISWGGFNAIQVGMLGPPALGAIVAVDAADDLFHLDIHYIDGMVHLDEYELGIDMWNAMTPAPDFPVDDAALGDRFDAEPWLLSWLRHQRDGPFWRRGSLRPRYERLGVPALLVGGWYDGYRDSVPRMLQHVPAHTRAIVGPWNHTYPHSAEPGPAIEWRHLVARWWDQWLRGTDTGILQEPRIAVYVRDWAPPDPGLKLVPGAWRAEDAWPPAGARALRFHLRADGGLGEEPSTAEVHALQYRPTAGHEAGAWWGELTVDQATLDEACLVYDSAPLEEGMVVLGMPSAELRASVDAQLAHFFVRLSDVAPDGRVTLVTGGGLNGAHRLSSTDPEPLDPGRVELLSVPMRFTSWTFRAGHRIRVAVSNALWPMIWPTPHPMTLDLHVGSEGSSVELPVVPAEGSPPPPFPDPERTESPPGVGSRGEILPVVWTTHRDGTRSTASWEGRSEAWFPWGRQNLMERLVFQADDQDPASSSARGEGRAVVRLEGRTLTWSVDLDLRSDATHFHYRYRRRLHQDGSLLRERHWEESIPRDHQ